jgi:hypothetical protein
MAAPIDLTCSRCAESRAEVRITWGDSDLRMRWCPRCDRRQWRVDGRRAGLESVLATIRSGVRVGSSMENFSAYT